VSGLCRHLGAPGEREPPSGLEESERSEEGRSQVFVDRFVNVFGDPVPLSLDIPLRIVRIAPGRWAATAGFIRECAPVRGKPPLGKATCALSRIALVSASDGFGNLSGSRGVHPKLVQELLAHATVAITLDTYIHVMTSMRDATARAMADTLA
jgi:hypothetical protein